MSHPACLPVETLLSCCEVQRTRGSGPGGQHRNKVETAIVIRHLPSGVIGQASEKRSQAKNRQQALFRLRLNLALALRTPAQPPSALWRERSRNRKLNVNPAHDDAPALLAEALDQIHGFQFDLAAAARALNVSNSQLAKFLKSIPAAWEAVNRERESRGLHRLK